MTDGMAAAVATMMYRQYHCVDTLLSLPQQLTASEVVEGREILLKNPLSNRLFSEK